MKMDDHVTKRTLIHEGNEPTTLAKRNLRFFLVACYQASVSIETMSNNLGLDEDTIRSELLRGIEAWNAAQL